METTNIHSEQDRNNGQSNEPIIVKADEVDEAGADISTIEPRENDDFDARIESRRLFDIQALGSPRSLANAVPGAPDPPNAPVRPLLRREGSAPPPPPNEPPPAAPKIDQENAGHSTDSLSLAELRNIVKDLPRLEPIAYAYTYEDTRTMAEELDEWFQYTEEDRNMLGTARKSYEETVSTFDFGIAKATISHPPSWLGLPVECREQFISSQLKDLEALEAADVARRLACVAYTALGVWQETAWILEDPPPEDEPDYKPPNKKYRRTIVQRRYIQHTADSLCRIGAMQSLYDMMMKICDDDEAYGIIKPSTLPRAEETTASTKNIQDQQLNCLLTIFYFVVESGRQQLKSKGCDTIRKTIASLQPNLLQYLSHLISRLRWDDSSTAPLTRILLLMWKSVLFLFGGEKELAACKAILRVEHESDDQEGEGFLTASPLDYHIFRQEITSKYPAYNPPPPLVPLELNNNSILPPLANHPSRNTGQDSLFTGPSVISNGTGKSIFQQPVHIATPAPSPPPSPAGPGGKGGKKQNYQTNQNFPFLYPPLDDTSNIIGGKGDVGLQDRLVGKRWEGSDIPASILEAGQLFASRMRMSRSLRQLWEVREQFMKFERGWEDGGSGDALDAKPKNSPANVEDATNNPSVIDDSKPLDHINTRETDDDDVQGRLDAVEAFYRNSLPHLQSIVIILLKVLLANASVMGVPVNSQAAPVNNVDQLELARCGTTDDKMPKNNQNLAKQLNRPMVNNKPAEVPVGPVTLEELNTTRLREITSKAVSGMLLLMLKWFRVSHVLKFEYMTQLLIDSNYLPLVLKFFAHQDVDRAVDQKTEREDLNFFHFCYSKAGRNADDPFPRVESSSSSEDEAQPPPISKIRRKSPARDSSSPPSNSPSRSSPSPPPRPEVDELGYPTTALPPTPLTTYAPRFFFTTITALRILQKITKGKAHRALCLVQYKSSAILRRHLKIPQTSLRLYNLKLFKSQVPFCGRKWRQTNMRVITAIYLHCKPELRDEWISGQNVEDGVEEAVPLEQAGRALVHWWHLRRYRDCMGPGARAGTGEDRDASDSIKRQEAASDSDFFVRELEKMGWGVRGTDRGADDEVEEDAVRGAEHVRQISGNGQGEWDGGPLQSEGW